MDAATAEGMILEHKIAQFTCVTGRKVYAVSVNPATKLGKYNIMHVVYRLYVKYIQISMFTIGCPIPAFCGRWVVSKPTCLNNASDAVSTINECALPLTVHTPGRVLLRYVTEAALGKPKSYPYRANHRSLMPSIDLDENGNAPRSFWFTPPSKHIIHSSKQIRHAGSDYM